MRIWIDLRWCSDLMWGCNNEISYVYVCVCVCVYVCPFVCVLDGSLTVCHSVKIPKDDQRQRIGSCQSHNTRQGITYESPLCSAFLSDFNSTVLCCRSSDVLGGPSYCLPGVTSRATCSVLGMIVWRNEGMTRVWGRWHSLSADLSYTEY